MGEKVTCSPLTAASLAAILAHRMESSGSNAAPCPSGIGNTVLYPLMTSSINSNGIRCGCFSIYAFCPFFTAAAPDTPIAEPARSIFSCVNPFSAIGPVATDAPRKKEPATWFICPIFSSSDMSSNSSCNASFVMLLLLVHICFSSVFSLNFLRYSSGEYPVFSLNIFVK